jgi:hypothetical protein
MAIQYRLKRGGVMKQFKTARLALLVGAFAFAFQAGPAQADVDAASAGAGFASAVGTLIYSPIKVAYSVLGVVVGGFAYGLSGGDADVMQAVMTPAVHGDYVLTSEHITLERPLEFFGREPGYQEEVVLEEIY